MTEAGPRCAEEIFKVAIAAPSCQRAALIAAHCGPDVELRAEVESLLAHHDAAGGFLEAPASALAACGVALAESRDAGVIPPNRQIGGFRVVDVLGAGGMGVVYLAEQQHPRRTVALKLIRPGLANPSILRRFEHEADILARLQHPGIAQVFEAGAADAGFGAQPYFAMERIEGEPLVAYADRNVLDARRRVELLIRVCDAVHHAHQKGVIHRDLKPANILVDATGQPKVLDFGVARVAGSDVRMTRQTDAGQLVGTLAYMSPEQCAGDTHDVDIRADVYSLGVIAFELLAGRLPFEIDSLSFPHAVRTICEQEPPALSTVQRMLRGDLETIVAKSLEKDRAARYQSASELAADLGRFLRDEPIVARPPSALYHFRKFVRRHRPWVAAAVMVFISLALGLVVSLSQAHRAIEQRNLAAAAHRAAEERRIAAERESRKAQQIQTFLESVLKSVHPEQAKGRDVTVLREMFDNAARRIESELADQPDVVATLHHTIALSYGGIGLYGRATEHFTVALRIRLATLGEFHRDTLESMHELAAILRTQDKLEQAQPYYRRILVIERRIGTGIDVANVANGLGVLCQQQGRFAEAEGLYREAAAVFRQSRGDSDMMTLNTTTNLLVLLVKQCRLDEAAQLYVQVVQLDPDYFAGGARRKNILAGLLQDHGYLHEAEQLLREALEENRRIQGPENFHTLYTLTNLVDVLLAAGEFDRAEQLAEQSVELAWKVLGENHHVTRRATYNLARVRQRQGCLGEALVLFAIALNDLEKIIPPAERIRWNVLADYATCLADAGRYDEAQGYARAAFDGLLAACGRTCEDTRRAARACEALFEARGDSRRAAQFLAQYADLLDPPICAEQRPTLERAGER